MQYYFSTVRSRTFAAGDKTVHNIVAGVGVTEGAAGDLKVGLPLQSLFVEDRAFHEPVRLLTLVEAPLTRIDGVIARNPVLRELFGGRWVHLAARNSRQAPWMLRRADGSWPGGSTDHGIPQRRQHYDRTGGPRWMTHGS